MTDIAFFLVNLNGGGAEKVMLSLASGFAEKGLKVDLVVAILEGEYLSLVSPKVRLIDLKSSRLISSLPSLISYLRQNRPQVLISALEDPNTIAVIAKRLAGVSTSVILTVHNHLSRASKQSKNLKVKLIPLFVRLFYSWADGIVAVSQGVAEDAAQMSNLPLDKVKVIYNPIFTNDLIEKFDQPVNHSWFLQNQPPVILGVGRLTKQKDFPTLIRAFALVKKQYSARLMILGQGEDLPSLQALVTELGLEEDVCFPGFVPNPYAYMKQASLCVLSSIFEGFGNVLVEAMLAGTPVVSTDCESGPAEILADGKYGDLVAVGDFESLATAMINTLKNPLDSQLLQKRGQEFSLEAALTKYEQLLKSN
ncbi:glycosyltransferase [Dolichospermum sp. UHCC 0259]|uniref:glycosyltransferase n=1 Tax=Dolichospermum sp. UHCC 0259 TaxID=2590010 RepID=UPI00144858E9|nr:glycosyltransferase [Dolichospermum sp. UHCC 0259]MTJ48424.1 glycosyltransferase [Dolichospermum sp. UHCC 0259]